MSKKPPSKPPSKPPGKPPRKSGSPRAIVVGGPRIDRRTALKGLGAASVLPLVAGCTPEGVDDPLPTELTREILADRIDTVVLVMMENRTFDHMFGSLTIDEGRADVDGLTADMSNPHPEGGDVAVYPAEEFCVEDPPHGWGASHDQFNDGAMDGFVSEHFDRVPEDAHQVMGYFDRARLPASYALADEFVLCDRWFSSLMTGTWPNRFYWLAGQSGGVQGNDSPDVDFDDIMNRVEDSGRSWICYYSNLPFSILLPNRSLADEGRYEGIEQFFSHAALGALPNLVVIDPDFGRADDHPPTHPVAGQIFMASIYEALRQSPQWDRTMLVITYDEHGGFYDHVPPPLAADDRASEGFDQLGFRVPTVVAGPWVKQGHVDNTTYDHTSALAFIEHLWDLAPLSARDAAADPMLATLDVERLLNNDPRPGPALPVIEADEDELFADECQYIFLRSDEQPPVTGQPELEQHVDEHYLGTWVDRRGETESVFRFILDMAVELGVLRRT